MQASTYVYVVRGGIHTGLSRQTPIKSMYKHIHTQLTLSVASREPKRHLGRILAYHVIPGKRAGLTEFVNSGDTVRASVVS